MIDVGLVTTPTLGICTKKMKASGGIMISASHNDEKWNALKLLNNNGEFLSPDNAALIIKDVERTPNPSSKGKITQYHKALKDHIDLVLSQKEVSKKKYIQSHFLLLLMGSIL